MIYDRKACVWEAGLLKCVQMESKLRNCTELHPLLTYVSIITC